MNNETTVDILNDLLTKAYDAEQGYAKAAERAENRSGLIAFFKKQSELRYEFGHEIKEAIGRCGGEPDKGSSVAAKAHQIWITVKESLAGDDSDEAILEECIRGEEFALEEYDEALQNEDLPSDVSDLIRSHRKQISSALSSLELKEASVD